MSQAKLTRSLFVPAKDRGAIREQVNQLAWLLDNSVKIPVINYRIGLDSIVGLIPGIGDFAGLILSSYIVVQAARLGVSRSILMRMIANVGLETLIGVIPVVGDLFDMTFKANQRNVKLLNQSLSDPLRMRRQSRSLVAVALAGIVGVVGTITAGIAWIAREMWLIAT